MDKPIFPNARILVVDDEKTNVTLLESILERQGYTNVTSTTNPRDVLAMFTEAEPDLIILDLMMPEMSGFEVMQQLAPLIPKGAFLPILVLTADAALATKRKALGAQATDYLTKPFDYAEVVLRIWNLLATRFFHLQLRDQNEVLERKVTERTADLHDALERLKAAQQQAIQQERLSALGVMASGVVHDFNNALTVILGFSEQLLGESKRPSINAQEITKPMQSIIAAARDASRIVRRLREFYRPRNASEVRVPVDLSALAEEAAAITSPRWNTQVAQNGKVVRVNLQLAKVPRISGDVAELREMLTNLIFNAVDAMPEGGTITLHTSSKGDRVVLQVADTGVGMSEEVRRKCFEPFFTTKGDHGTGLGLAMVYGIADRHGAEIEIASEPGKGATFTFRFPVAAEQAARTLDAVSQADQSVSADSSSREKSNSVEIPRIAGRFEQLPARARARTKHPTELDLVG